MAARACRGPANQGRPGGVDGARGGGGREVEVGGGVPLGRSAGSRRAVVLTGPVAAPCVRAGGRSG